MAQYGASVAPNGGSLAYSTGGSSTTGNLSIMDLSNEVLDLVFQYLPVGRTDVKNTRLTCRRFRDLGSKYLISQITVAITKESLHHLERVSRHPLLSKGVSCVRLNLALYDLSQATTLERFRDYQLKRLGDLTPQYHMQAAQRFVRRRHPPGAIEDRERLLEATRRMREDLEAASANRGPPVVLLRDFQDFRECCDEQQELLERDMFCRRVVSAFEAMPSAKTLTIVDEVTPLEEVLTLDPLLPTMSPDEWLRQTLARPRVSLEESARQTTTSLIPTILIRLGEAGVLLRSLTIHLMHGWAVMDEPPEGSLDHLSLDSRNQRERLKASVKNLRHLKFTRLPQDRLPDPADGTVHILHSFLSTIVDTESLEFVDILTGLLWFAVEFPQSTPGEARAIPSGSLKIRPWPNLKHASFDGMWFSYKDLTSLALQPNRAVPKLDLRNIYLRDRSWADLLDGFRDSDVSGARIRLPSGAEYQDWVDALWAGGDAFHGPGPWPFCGHGMKPGGPSSRTDLYIQGRLKHNPLRECPPGADPDEMENEEDREVAGPCEVCLRLRLG